MAFGQQYYQLMSKLSPAERRQLAERWTRRALVLAAEVDVHGPFLRHIANAPELGPQLDGLIKSLLSRGSLAGPEHMIVDRLFAIVGNFRRGQTAKLGEHLLDIAQALDEAAGRAEDSRALMSTGSASPFAVSVQVDRTDTTAVNVESEMMEHLRALTALR